MRRLPVEGERTEPVRRVPAPPIWAVVALLAAFLALEHGGALTAPFFSDDYIFFDKLRGASFPSLWAPTDLAYHWYRPWSRELHAWTLLHLFGRRPLPYHLACFALWLPVMGLYFALASRIAGRLAAAVAVSGVAALAAWGILLEWAPGAQELWMLLFALLGLNAFARGQAPLATASLTLALLSKETAVVLPAIAFLYAVAIDRDPPRRALARVLPLGCVALLWAAFHPMLGGRLWWPQPSYPLPPSNPPPWIAVARSALMLANLDAWPRPLGGWGPALALAAPGALLLGALVAWAALADRSCTGGTAAEAADPARAEGSPLEAEGRGQSLQRVLALAAGWTAIGWIPLFLPSLVWQPYYSLLGALGAWLGVGAGLRSRPQLAATLVLGVALLRGPRADTPSREWGNEWLQRFGKTFMGYTESYLRGRLPSLPRHSRLFFTTVPRGVVFILGRYDAPALRVWYDDSTIQGAYWSDYRLRTASDSIGPDYFFRFDSLAGWIEIDRGEEDLASARATNPRWQADHEALALVLARAGDARGAGAEYVKLAAAFPDNVNYAFLAGTCFEALGDSSAAGRWYRRAAELPGASEEVRAEARRFAPAPRGP